MVGDEGVSGMAGAVSWFPGTLWPCLWAQSPLGIWQAVPLWVVQRDKLCPLLISLFPPRQVGLCLPLLSSSPSLCLSVLPSFSLPSLLIKLHSQALFTRHACYPWRLWDVTKVPLLPCLAVRVWEREGRRDCMSVGQRERSVQLLFIHAFSSSSNWRYWVTSAQIHLELHFLV